MKSWLLLSIVGLSLFSVGTAVAGDERSTLNAKQIFQFVETLQHEAFIGSMNKSPESCNIIPEGIDVLQSFLKGEVMVSDSDRLCDYPEPKYENCKNACIARYPIPPATNLRPRLTCFGVCTDTCLN